MVLQFFLSSLLFDAGMGLFFAETVKCEWRCFPYIHGPPSQSVEGGPLGSTVIQKGQVTGRSMGSISRDSLSEGVKLWY